MKFVYTIFVFLSFNAMAQHEESKALMNAFFQDTLFCKIVVSGCDGFCDAITIIDTSKFLTAENVPSEMPYSEKKVPIKYLQLYEKNLNEDFLRSRRRCEVFITVERNKRKYRIYFFARNSNGLGHFDYTRRGNKFIRTNRPVLSQF